MRWPPWRKATPPDDEAGMVAAQERLEAAHAAQPEVSRVVRQLRQIREHNNFAALITAALKEHR